LIVADGRTSGLQQDMAEENNSPPGNAARSGPADRDFAPLTEIRPKSSETEESAADKKRGRPRGMPSARVDPGVVKEFEEEIDTKVKSGTSRMRWFANHLILFVIAITAIIPLRLTILTDYHDAFFYVPIGAWIALLALHASYAMRPLLRRSRRESQIKAVVPGTGDQTPSEPG